MELPDVEEVGAVQRRGGARPLSVLGAALQPPAAAAPSTTGTQINIITHCYWQFLVQRTLDISNKVTRKDWTFRKAGTDPNGKTLASHCGALSSLSRVRQCFICGGRTRTNEGFPARDSPALPAKRHFNTALYPSLTAHAKMCDSPDLRISKSRLAG